MKEMLLFVTLGISLVGIFVFLLWQSAAHNEQDKPTHSSDSEKSPLPAELLIERIFGSDDWNFLRNRAPRDAQQQFLKDRREIALFWLALMRARTRTAMNFHLTHARSLHSVEPLLEFRIAANYLAFQVSCSLVSGLLWLQGPISTRWIFRRVDLLCGKLHAMTRVPLRSDPGSLA
jgi:hypothetical protein